MTVLSQDKAETTQVSRGSGARGVSRPQRLGSSPPDRNAPRRPQRLILPVQHRTARWYSPTVTTRLRSAPLRGGKPPRKPKLSPEAGERPRTPQKATIARRRPPPHAPRAPIGPRPRGLLGKSRERQLFPACGSPPRPVARADSGPPLAGGPKMEELCGVGAAAPLRGDAEEPKQVTARRGAPRSARRVGGWCSRAGRAEARGCKHSPQECFKLPHRRTSSFQFGE